MKPLLIRTIRIKNRFIADLVLLLGVVLFATSAFAQSVTPAELIPFWNDREADSKIFVDHSRWQSLLDRYLDSEHPTGVSRFDYAAVSNQDQRSLNSYLNYLQSLEPRQLNDLEQKAYWLNLYNATTISLILSTGSDIRSLRQIRSGLFSAGPWNRKLLKIAGQDLSLADMAHGIIRPMWNDPRVHYAMNFASISGPNLPNTAFTGKNVEALLETAAKDYINHNRAVRVISGRLNLSSIYQWYAADFGNNFADLIIHLQAYAEPELRELLQGFRNAEYDYEWGLNRP